MSKLTLAVEREDDEDGSITYHLWDVTDGGYSWIVGFNDDKSDQGGKAKHYADNIAHAVNCHDGLVAALRLCAAWDEGKHSLPSSDWDGAMKACREALAKAEGQT